MCKILKFIITIILVTKEFIFFLQTTFGKYVQIYGHPTFWYRSLLEVHASQKIARVSISSIEGLA
jgi:hypothetical protein